jgi:hypothetical protein
MFRMFDKLVVHFKLNKRIILPFKIRNVFPGMLRMSSETVVNRFSTLLPVKRKSRFK